MRLRLHVVMALIRKDLARLLRNGPALMLLGLMVVVAFLVGSSGLVSDGGGSSQARPEAPGAWIVYWDDGEWVEFLKRRAPPELGIRFVAHDSIGTKKYTASSCVIELREPLFDPGRKVLRRHIRYRYPGTDPKVLWGVTRWFLAASVVHFGQIPQFFETIEPLVSADPPDPARSALENVSVADILSLELVATALLTTVLFFAACGLLVSLTAQERERGSLRALLLSPCTYFEFLLAKGFVHGTLAMLAVGLVMAGLQPSALGSLAFWATVSTWAMGYFGIGLLISSFAKDQMAPNLLSFAYLLAIGALNLFGQRYEVFRFLSGLTFERYGLVLTLSSVKNPDLGLQASLAFLRTNEFRALVLLSSGMLLIAAFVGSRRLRRG